MFKVRLVQRPPSAEKIAKNINFGVASGLTQTAKEGQEAVKGALRGTFTLRGGWFEQQNKFGIKVKPAKRDDLSAEIRTNADWIEKQKKGGNISGSQNVRTFHYTFEGTRYIAEPSRELRPKGSKKVIGRAQWPSRLRRKKGTFVIKTRGRKIPLLMSRFAPGKSGVAAMYILRRAVTIKPVDTFYDPITKVVRRRGEENIRRGIARALATMK